MSEKIGMVKNITTVSFFTLLSRISGLIRDSVMAYLFGAGYFSDAFNIAFTIPNLFRRLFAEGAMSIAFIPVFTEYKINYPEEESKKLYNSTFTYFTIILIFFTILGIIFSPFIVKLFAPGFSYEKLNLTINLNRLMFPYIFFIGVASFLSAILNIYKDFLAPSASPILLNISIILCAFFLSFIIKPQIYGAGIGVILGGFLQLILLPYFVKKKNVSLKIDFYKHPAMKKMLYLMVPSLFGIAVYQFNILISRALASLLPEGSVTYIYFSDRFLELPLGIFAVSIATVALPNLSAFNFDINKFRETYTFSLKLGFFVCIPAMIWLMVMRIPLISLLLQHGNFGIEDTLKAADVFFTASFGIWAVTGVRITVPAFYSMQDTKSPVIVAFFSFILNAGLSAFSVFFTNLGPMGLTLANSISSFFNFLLLVYLLRKKIKSINGTELIKSIIKILVASTVMAITIYPITKFSIWLTLEKNLLKSLYIGIALLGSSFLYISITYLLKLEEVEKFIKRIKK